MNRQRPLYPVKLMARVLGVSRSGFYAWLTREPSLRSVNDEKMKPLIRIAHKAGRGTYGPRCIEKRKFKATTNSAHSLPVAENLLDQQFTVTDPGTAYGTDITYSALGLHKPSEMVNGARV